MRTTKVDMMDTSFYERVLEECVQGQEAFCTIACPFHLDVRAFIDKLQRRNFGAAFRAYRNTVVFPQIVSYLCHRPCEDACIRRNCDSPVQLALLERACVAHAKKREPASFNLPLKNKKVAIIGAGVSGLGCALRLAARKYDVTVYEKSGRIGGKLWELLPPEIFLGDFEEQFRHEKYTLELNTEINCLSEISADAIYIATGQGGQDFQLRSQTNENNFGTDRPGVFLGGDCLRANMPPVMALEHGLRSALFMEMFLQSGSMNFAETNNAKLCETALKINERHLSFQDKISPTDEDYNEDEAAREATRCLRCDCNDCVQGCMLMTTYKKNPRRLANDVEVAFEGFNPNPKTSNRLVNSCDDCGLCQQLCPNGAHISEMLLDARREMLRKELMPAAYHDYWIRDMLFSNGDEACVTWAPQEKCEYLFFPGCHLGASDPRYVIEAYRTLLKKRPDMGICTLCCGAPAQWGGEAGLHEETLKKIREIWTSFGCPQVVFACPTCKKMFSRNLPEIEGASLYTLLTEEPFDKEQENGKKLVIFDSCSSRYDPVMQENIRELIKKTGVSFEDLPGQKEYPSCCSYGGNIAGANPKFAAEMVQKCVEKSESTYLTYCTNCRDTFAAAGKPTLHILDLLFHLNSEFRKSPAIVERRENRRALKRMLAQMLEGIEIAERERPKLFLSPELAQKLDDLYIQEDDVREVIMQCEKSGRKLADQRTESFIGHARIGAMTYWVEYQPKEKGFLVLNAYGHRLQIEER